jgi:hypothetical protein
MMNFIGSLTGGRSQDFASVYRTVEAVFPFLAVYQIDSKPDWSSLQNLILVASLKEPSLPPTASLSAQVQALLSQRVDDFSVPAGDILTDDRAFYALN